jgi:S-adenosylhomocysteine hydrolase
MGGNGWDRAFFVDKKTEAAGDWIIKIHLDDAKHIYEVAKGLPVNFIFASGTDTETMDVVFSLSLLAFEYLVKNYSSLPKTLQPIPEKIQSKHLELVERLSKRTDIFQQKEE